MEVDGGRQATGVQEAHEEGICVVSLNGELKRTTDWQHRRKRGLVVDPVARMAVEGTYEVAG
jgi:hypothetical protein